ncbi:MAG: ribbon-helix-helix domain-containing protein [Nanoarchaeota archaeon]|nr:ribbon-helix-helix domain-containing protein [Nanoarchaeota archaeon]
MRFDEKNINRIMKKYKDAFDILEYYDRTRIKLWGRERIDITLHRKIIKKLRDLKKKTGKPISRIIEESLEKNL